MKYTHDRITNKVFYVERGWSGGFEIKEYRNGQYATTLSITEEEHAVWTERLRNGGWKVAN